MTGASDRAWVEQAACRDQPSRQFTDPDGPHDVHAAISTCHQCPVKRQCLTTALRHTTDADVGIWGGTTEYDRRRIRAGTLTIDDALQPLDPARDIDDTVQPPRSVRDLGSAAPVVPRRPQAPPRLPASEVTLARTRGGEYQSADERVIVFRIHGDPPWMLMIDGRPIARTATITEARRIAWTTLHAPGEQALTEARRMAWATVDHATQDLVQARR